MITVMRTYFRHGSKTITANKVLTCITVVVFAHCLHELLRPVVFDALNDLAHPETGTSGELLYQLC